MASLTRWTAVAMVAGLGTLSAIAVTCHFIGREKITRYWISAKVQEIIAFTSTNDASLHGNGSYDVRQSIIDGRATPITSIGIHVSSPGSTESFANLALGPEWTIRQAGRANPNPRPNVDKDGYIITLEPGSVAIRYLTPPAGNNKDILIHCSYAGEASVEVAGPSVRPIRNMPNSLDVAWNPRRYPASLNVRDMNPLDPIKDVDCRNAAVPREARFAPAFLRLINGFKVLRFMDWQNTNADLPVTWANRHTPRALAISEADGVSIEDMVALARLNRSDAWFNMPSRADDDYIRHFAQYVYRNLPADHKVFVEFGNEVWNWSFPVSRHILQEGLNAGLGNHAKEAISFRYAERLIHVMDIWADVFRDAPHRLVRVAAGQSGDSYRSNMILNYKDVPHHVDAFATAPYFAYDQSGNPSDLSEIFRKIDVGVESALRAAEAQKAIAAQHGLRFVAYEAGQGIVLSNVDLNMQIQQDPRMYSAYRHYVDGWRRRVGDTIILFGTVFRTRQSGAWGLLEYEGQLSTEAPKYRAVQDEIAQ